MVSASFTTAVKEHKSDQVGLMTGEEFVLTVKPEFLCKKIYAYLPSIEMTKLLSLYLVIYFRLILVSTHFKMYAKH